MAPISFLSLVIACLLGVPALSDSVKSLLTGYPQRRREQTAADGLVSYPCPPNTFITSIGLKAGAWVDYLDYFWCNGTLSSVDVHVGDSTVATTNTLITSDVFFIQQSHGTETNGHVTDLYLYSDLGSAGPCGSSAMVQTDALTDSNQGVTGAFAMGIKVSLKDAYGLSDFQFIYDTLAVRCGAAASGYACTDWEGCCSSAGYCGITDAECSTGCQTGYGSCTPTTSSPTFAPTESITQSPTSIPTASPTSSVTQTPTAQATIATSAPTAPITQAPTSVPVTARDLVITFSIMDTTVASSDEAALLTASALLANVSEESIQMTLTDVISTGARRLDTTTVAVTENITASTVATDEITAAGLEALTGLVITDFMVMPASGSGGVTAGLLAGVIVGAIALCGILACAFYRRKTRKNAAKAAPKVDVENVAVKNVPAVHGAKVSAPVYTAPTHGASHSRSPPAVARTIAGRQSEKLPPSYRAPSII